MYDPAPSYDDAPLNRFDGFTHDADLYRIAEYAADRAQSEETD
jgi:hypothetical protein